MLVRNLLLLLLVYFVARALWRFLGGVARGVSTPSSASGRSAAPPATKMMKDPVCGTYVVPGRALEFVSGRETLYFCSDACRARFIENT